MARLAGLNHWMTSDNSLARELASIGNFAALFARQIDEALLFHAPLKGCSLFPIRGYRPPLIERSSEALETSAIEGRLRDQCQSAARIEYDSQHNKGFLGERATTQLCRNFNRAPDLALTGLTLSGEPTATLSRSEDLSALRAAKLAALSQNGYVFELDNTDPAAASNAIVTVSGMTGGNGEHTLSVYARGHGFLSLNLEGMAPQSFALTEDYQRFSMRQTDTLDARQLQISLTPGSHAYWLGNQLELMPTVTSCIASVSAAPVSRAQDRIDYGLLDIHGDQIIDEAHGMLACEVMIPVDPPDAVSDQGGRINYYAQNWLYFQFVTGSYNVNTKYTINPNGDPGFMSRAIDELKADQPVVLAVLWDKATNYLQNGWKGDGVWYWGVPRTNYFGFWDLQGGLYITQSAVPTWQKNLRIWNVNRGLAWIENFYKDLANA